MNDSPQDVFAAANSAAYQLGLPWTWILAQWALESGNFQAPCAENNYAGVTTDGVVGHWRSFSSLQDFANAWVVFMKDNFSRVQSATTFDGYIQGLVHGKYGCYFGSQSAASYAAEVESRFPKVNSDGTPAYGVNGNLILSGGNYVASAAQFKGSASSNSTGQSADGQTIAGLGGDIGELATLPNTNYQIVPESQVKGNILYGRKWRVFVADKDTGATAIDVSDLHVTFKIYKLLIMQPLFSQIVIYNLSPQTENAIIQEGYRVVIDAGYEGGQFGTIFDGNVTQVIREKENGNTYKLTLLAMDNDEFMVYGTANFAVTRGENARSDIPKLITESTISSNIGSISDSLSVNTRTRGKVFFGKAADYLQQIADGNNAFLSSADGQINIIKLTDLPDNEVYELNSETGMIGVPTQVDYGATVKMLMNPRIKIKDLIHVDNSQIVNQAFTSPGSPIYLLDQSGMYRVTKITYTGDTRGNDWYTEVDTVKQSGVAPDIQVTPDTNAQ
jgi:hypothetical protein